MPIHEYLCRDCGHQFEEIVRKPDDKPACPHCEAGGRVEKLPSAPGGYVMNSGGSSTRPRHAGAFKGRKS